MRAHRAALAATALAAATGCQGIEIAPTGQEAAESLQGSAGGSRESVEVTVHDADGQELGTVTLEERTGEETVEVTADLDGLSPGFHGFHIHETGRCIVELSKGPFTSAGGHFAPEGRDHPDHAGDLPPLLVLEDGSAESSLRTDRFALTDLADEDGSAIIVHDDPDNLANVPERYLDDSTPDQDTRDTGDAGGRYACGVIAGPEG